MLNVTLLQDIEYPKFEYPAEKIGTYAIAKMQKIGQEEFLAIYFYDVSGGSSIKNAFQYFCGRQNAIIMKGDKKTIKALCHRGTFTCVEGEEIAREFFASMNIRGKKLHNIVKEYEALMTREKEIDFFQNRISKSYLKQVRKKVFSDANFLFYNKEEKTGYCNVCHKEVELDQPLKHLQESRCPHCRSKIILRDLRKGRKNLQFLKWSLKIEEKQGQLLLRYFRHHWNMLDYKSSFETKEMIRTILRVDFTIKEFSLENNQWEDYKRLYGCMGKEPSEFLRPRSVYYPQTKREIKKAVEESNYRYSGLAEYLKDRNRDYPFQVENYLLQWIKFPNLEKLSKVGFTNIVNDSLDSLEGYYYTRLNINLKEATLDKILKVKKEHFRWLLKVSNPKSTDVKILQKYPEIKEKDYFLLLNIPDYKRNYDAYMEILSYTTLHKAKKYLEAQVKLTPTVTGRYYLDYLTMAQKAEKDLKNSFHLFPKYLVQRHDEVMKEIKDKEDALKEEYNQMLQEHPEQSREYFSLGKYLLRLPKNCEEIKTEGEVLHHCVGNYVDRVIAGTTQIFFLREKENADTPFYTVEWKDNEVKQCYGYRNCKATPEVQGFVAAFKNFMLSATA